MSLPTTYNLLSRHLNTTFIETGSYRGDSVQQALEAGFVNIRSIDISEHNIDFCKHRFDLYRSPQGHLQFYEGDSAEILYDVIADVQDPITFFLDSHWQLFEDEEKGNNPFPLLKELQQIAQHPIKAHTILIDDILVLTHPDVTGWSLKKIKAEVLKINPTYKFELIANPVVNNFLICKVK